jgi:YfiH family protein
MEWRERNGVRWLGCALPGAEVAFSTRIGGVSAPPFDTLNLGVLTDDAEADARANRERLTAALGLAGERVTIARQVHEATVLDHEGPQLPAPWIADGVDPPVADGHRTRDRELALLVFVADCLPIAVSDGEQLAMLHGGWRPLAAGIVGRGTAGMRGGVAAIGPGIGPCCFEVGEEVLAAFAGLGPDIANGRMLDLPEVACRLLEREGIEVVERSRLCTRCHPELFFSHRGQGPETGRQGGIAWRTA